MKLHFYSDAGHGWVKVSKKLLVKLGIADKVSGYSYARNDSAYLEEDCDASLLIGALQEKGIAFEIVEHCTNRQSRIRGYAVYCQ